MDEGFGGNLVGICHNRPSEAHGFGCGGLQATLQAAPSLAWSCSRYAISDGGLARPHIPGTRLFVLFHPTQATIPTNLTKSSSRYQIEP
ncbi:MAG: hypothetical protein PUE05_04400 [bacterium]|nr:hypothetical protein [bacterium]